jgi:uncharacterized protein (DUF849 family)
MLIEAATNGSRRKAEHSAVPETPKEIAAAALESARAGATAIHFHLRSVDGQETLAPEALELTLTAVRSSAPNVPVGVSTGTWIVPDPEIRLEVIRGWRMNPDFASVNFHEAGATDLAHHFLNRSIGVEAGLSTPEAAEALIKSGIAGRVLRILIEPQEQDLQQALAMVHNIEEVFASNPVDSRLLMHGSDRTTWELLDEAIRSGYDIRIGFEDTLKLPDGEIARNNSVLIHGAQMRVRSLRR